MNTHRLIRVRAGAALVVLLAVVVCVSGGPAGAHRAEARGTGYLAIGDSVPFGYMPSLEDPWVPERFVGYPELIDRYTRYTTTNITCPGQTAQALLSFDAPDAGCFEMRQAAQEEGFPLLHTDYEGTQLDAALAAVRSPHPPSLISIQAGGNDWAMCAFDAPDPDECLAEVLPAVTRSLASLATQLRAAGHRGPIVIVGYYLLPGFEQSMQGLNRAIRTAAAQAHVSFADTARPFSLYARLHRGDICDAGLLARYDDGECDIHPTPIGQRMIAVSVLTAAVLSGR